jgi:C4-dicarboxylate-specific signal transduction histidine kinase
MQQLRIGKGWSGEYLARHRNGAQFYIRTAVTPIHDENGCLTGMIGVSEDITEQKRTEQQLIQADKMASLGLLSAGVAHEINNPVNLILLNTSLMKEVWGDVLPVLSDHAARGSQQTYGGLKMDYLKFKLPNLIDDTYMAAQRIESTVANLKHFSKMSDSRHREPVQINTAIQNAVRLAQSTLKKSNIQLELDLHDPLPEIEGNLQNVEQILLNLLINGIEAHGGAPGNIAIRTRCETTRQMVTVHMADTGKGVDPDIADKIFDPFVTSRLAEGGTGLGLAIVYNLVQSFGGDIDFQSETGKGTVFKVRFPMSGKGE